MLPKFSNKKPVIKENLSELPDDFAVLLKKQLHFLGVTLDINKEGVLTLHQQNYILSKLAKRGLLSGKSRPSLPVICEGQSPPVDKNAEYLVSLKRAQEEVGTLQWLAIKSRPDIAAAISMLASMQSRDPDQVVKLTTEVWRFLAGT